MRSSFITCCFEGSCSAARSFPMLYRAKLLGCRRPHERTRMELGITIPLQKFLHLRQPPYGTCADPFFCWDVHRVKIANGKVLLVASNASNRFIAITRMTAATWKTWERETFGTVQDALAISGFTEEAIAAYFAAAGLPEGPYATPQDDGTLLVTKTHGRSSVGCMNRAIDDIWFAGVDT